MKLNMPHDMDLRIEYVSVDDLVPYENNANIHTDEQIDQIAASIKEFGFCDPIGIWTDKQGRNVVTEGHGRVLAAKKLGLDKVPIIYLNGLTDDQRRAYTHIHNQLTRNSQFDFEKLEAELNALDFDFESLGFDGFPDLDKRDPDDNTGELDIEDYSEDKFECTCPRCGMRFNP